MSCSKLFKVYSQMTLKVADDMDPWVLHVTSDNFKAGSCMCAECDTTHEPKVLQISVSHRDPEVWDGLGAVVGP